MKVRIILHTKTQKIVAMTNIKSFYKEFMEELDESLFYTLEVNQSQVSENKWDYYHLKPTSGYLLNEYLLEEIQDNLVLLEHVFYTHIETLIDATKYIRGIDSIKDDIKIFYKAFILEDIEFHRDETEHLNFFNIPKVINHIYNN